MCFGICGCAAKPRLLWDVLLLNCGLHDIRTFPNGSRQTEPQTYAQNLKQIFSLAMVLATQKICWARIGPVYDAQHNYFEARL